MLLSRFKKALTRLTGRKKPGYARFSSDLNVRGAAAETGRPKSRLHGLLKLRKRMDAKKQDYGEDYRRPKSRMKTAASLLALSTFLIALPLLWIYGGEDKLRLKLQSITWCRVTKIEITGCMAVSKEKVLEASGIVPHQTSLLAIDSSEIEARIARVPWVSRATVNRSWPAKIEISIQENAPIAMLHTQDTGGSQLQYLDAAGAAFSAVLPGGDIDFPVITGLAEIADPQLRDKALSELLIFLGKVRGNDPHLPAHSVSELHVTREGEMVLFLVEYPFPIYFGNGNTKEKYSRLIQVLRSIYKKQNSKELLSQIKYIQMDYLNDKVLVVESDSGSIKNG